MEHGKEPAARADIDRLDQKIDVATNRLDKKIEATGKRLDEKIEATGKRLDEKIEATGKRLDEKIEATGKRLARGIVENQTEIKRTREDLTRLITESGSKTQGLVLEVLTEFRKLDRRQVITSHRVEKLEKRVDSLESSQ